jgi:hypothetical protein
MIFVAFFCILLLFAIFFAFKLFKHTSSNHTIEKTISKNIDNFISSVEDTMTPEQHFKLAELYHFGKFGKNKNIHQAIHEYNKVIQFSNDSHLVGKAFFNKAKLYEEVQPINISSIIDNYIKAFEHGIEESIINVGKIYMHGLHPFFLPDKLIASKIFSTFLDFSTSLHPWCNYFLKEINFDLKYTDLDSIPQHNQIVKYLPANIVFLLQHASKKIKSILPYSTVINDHDLQKFTFVDDDEPEIVFNKIPQNIIKNDSQNVHDHSLQNIGKQIIHVLQKDFSDDGSIFTQNYTKLLNKVPTNSKSSFERVCNSFSDLKHSKYDKSEKQIFNLVFNKIQNNNDFLDIFIDNILSCIESDVIVCSTGKIMRMLSTLDIIDSDTPTLKPDWVIKNEISQIISKTINDLSTSQKAEYNSDNNENIVDLIQTRVRAKCNNDYKNILDPSVLDIYLQDYFQYL